MKKWLKGGSTAGLLVSSLKTGSEVLSFRRESLHLHIERTHLRQFRHPVWTHLTRRRPEGWRDYISPFALEPLSILVEELQRIGQGGLGLSA